ncbi:amino acid adenylation domain-containing protein [Catenibacillus scindens]|uniref:amino acid adenylation domain-containing protein n=1 Tax=Catenibacillus scindens TaxID=673271 RepID=UPI003207AB2B
MTKNYLILDILEKTARRRPEKNGVIDAWGSCTYRQLAGMSQRVGSGLLNWVDPGKPVGIFMEKGINALTAFFGSVYAGGCYVMLSPQLPAPRLAQMAHVLELKVVIADDQTWEKASEIFSGQKIFNINDLKAETENQKGLALIRKNMLDTDPLYIMFTSGSSGVPKGVAVSHRSVMDFIDTFTGLFHISASDVIGNQAPFDFDVSVKDIYSAVKTGAKLVIIPRRLFSNPSGLLDFICSHKVTTMIWAVSALCLVTTFHGLDYKIPETVGKIMFSGEVMPWKHLKSWMDHLPDTVFVNLYGPTEITCNCTYHVVERNRDYSRGLPIGRPFPNKGVFLLDEQNREIKEAGKVGEICVRGTDLALGYFNAHEATKKSFVQNPLNKAYPETIYRTGDLGCLDDFFDIYFCGRKDFQVKYMGHRIELEEIERAIHNVPGVSRCCCVFDEKKSRLYGFYTGTISKGELSVKLKEKLPAFMIPTSLKWVEGMPLTPNGKTDRKALASGII